MRTLGDVKRYLKEDETHLFVPAISNPHFEGQYKNALAALLRRIAQDHGLEVSQIATLSDGSELSPEAEKLFSRFKGAVDRLVDSI